MHDDATVAPSCTQEIPTGLRQRIPDIYSLRKLHRKQGVLRRFMFASRHIPANTKHLYNIHTMLDQRQRRWADVV